MMLSWIFAALALYYVGLFIPSTMKLASEGFAWGVGPQDVPPKDTIALGRARRAHENLKENLPVYLSIAVLSMLMGADGAALTGAAIWVVSRVVYIPLYLFGVPYLRSLAFFASLFGLVLMILALIGTPAT